MDSVIKQLIKQPQQFEFYQAVNLLETWLKQRLGCGVATIKFSNNPSLQFASTDIADLQISPEKYANLTINFMGLTSPQGLLPIHYTEQILHLLQAKEPALAECLNWLQQRTFAFFYQAWRKHHAVQTEPTVVHLLQGLTGQRLVMQRATSSMPANFYIYYAQHFYKQPTASSLSQLLSDYFATPIVVKELQGEWLQIASEQTTRLQTIGEANNRLGIDMTAGNRIWQCQHKFRLRIGPLNTQQLAQFLPSGTALLTLKRLVRSCIGAQLQFALQVVIKADCIPAWQLNDNSLQLGWSTWLNSRTRQMDADDIILEERQDVASQLHRK